MSAAIIDHYEGKLAECADALDGWIQQAAKMEAQRDNLLEALKALVSDTQDYERINNLAPSPGRIHCWQSMTNAIAAIAKADSKS